MNLRLALSAALVAMGLLLSGCAASQQRGVTENTYYSSTRPAIQVSVRDMTLSAFGMGTGRLARTATLGGLKVDTWAAYYANGPKGEAGAVLQAELPDSWQWTTVYPPTQAMDARTQTVDGRTWTSWTSLVVASRDPFNGLAGESLAEDESVFWMQRTMTCIYAETQSKVILLYREPLPKELRDMNLFPDMDAKELRAFRERAAAAFVLDTPRALPGAGTSAGKTGGIRWRFVDDNLLGPVMERNITGY